MMQISNAPSSPSLKMQNPSDTERPFLCEMCKCKQKSVDACSEFETAVKQKHLAWVTHIITLHFNSKIPDRIDTKRLIYLLFLDADDDASIQSSIIAILNLLIDVEANVNVKFNSQRTMLHFAIEHQLRDVIDHLISCGADLQVREKRGNSIVHFLIRSESYKLARCDEAREDLKELGERSADFIRWLLSKGLDVDVLNDKGETALLLAATYNLLHALPILLERMTNAVDEIDIKAFIRFIVSTRRFDETLSRGGYTVKYNIDPALFYEIEFADEVYEKFLNKGFLLDDIVVDFIKTTPLHGAKLSYTHEGSNLLHLFSKPMYRFDYTDHRRIIYWLVREGCDVNAKDAKGATPLYYAVWYHNIGVIEELIGHGAEVNDPSVDGYTPLHKAALHGHDDVMAVLLKNGADVNAKTENGQTPLHLINVGLEGAIGRLIGCGAQVDVQDHEGVLPLHMAIRRRDERAMREFLRFGADVNDNADVLHSSDYSFLARFLTGYLIRLDAAGLRVDEKLRFLLQSTSDFADDLERCLKEIKSLKSYRITSFASLYDFLRMNRNSTCAYVENKKLKELIDCPPTLQQLFPMYHVLISSAYYRAAERRKMLEPAKDAWLELTNIHLPDICICEILNNLSNVHLRVMIEATNEMNDLKKE